MKTLKYVYFNGEQYESKEGLVLEIVTTLPATGETGKIYLVPAQSAETGNLYEEYIWHNNAWELFGTATIDLSGYATQTWANTELAKKQNLLVAGTNITLTPDATTGQVTIAANIQVDDALSETSLNAVQNRVLYGIFDSQRQIMEYMQDRIVALESKLKRFEETVLSMSDGTSTVRKIILAKDAPPDPGFYDVDGALIKTFEEAVQAGDIFPSTTYQGETYWNLESTVGTTFPDVVTISAPDDLTGASIWGWRAYPNLKKVYLGTGYESITNNTFGATENPVLEELHINETIQSIASNSFTSITSLLRIYYDGELTGAPWGAPNAEMM